MTDNLYVRTCQECLHRQVSTDPSFQKGDHWRDTKCKRCKSQALDYGSYGWTKVGGKLVKSQEEDE